ncbi:endonuclease SmrB [Candidatus Steffania adelgidicola]|uniref:endonuclease SmrB n=1 Tax=Candidatus Steffania adelgidicola TaxID=1076626 RepID=UPI001D002208|nr:endonuclease SmrB [Candidatus Steffania adelgidicola]
MKKPFTLAEGDLRLFRQSVLTVKPMLQDRVCLTPIKRIKTTLPSRHFFLEKSETTFYFSDDFQPCLQKAGPPHYVRTDVNPYEVKKLRRGDYTPELFLDLHGLTQTEAKQELGALLVTCRRKYIYCTCVIHGHGRHILKQRTPLWLAQHPHVKGFHQAPKAFGGSAALLILLELAS